MAEDDQELPRKIEPGDVLSGKYRVSQVLGEGGMGQVLQAVHEELEQKVAIKCLLPEVAKTEEAVTRFTNEAKALARLQSDHVARVQDVGKLDNGLPYMVMEFLEGSDLGELIETKGAMPVHEAAELVLQACAGLAEVHGAGIIHRDLKPSNMYVITKNDGTPCLKLLDFGISKLEGAPITRTSVVMGSPGFMSPEQLRSSKDVDERTDVWALGAILYEMLTAEHAFVAPNAPILCLKIAQEDPVPPRNIRPDIPAELETVILTCLQKVPEDRYFSVAELARELAPFAPERAKTYVAKIEATLRGAKVPPRAVRPLASEAQLRATVRATPESAPMKVASADAPKTPPAIAKSDVFEAPPSSAPAKSAPAKPARSRGRFVLFALGSLMGAGVAAAYFGDVQKIRAQVAQYIGDAAPSPTPILNPSPSPSPSPSPTPTPDPIPAPSMGAGGPGGSSEIVPGAVDALDAGADADVEEDGGEDDEEDAAVASADAGPTYKPAAPVKKKPRPKPKVKRPRRR